MTGNKQTTYEEVVPVRPTDKCDLSAQQLMHAQCKAEHELTHRAALYDLLNVLSGIASCATQCGCCQSHNESAAAALLRFERATGVTREEAYEGAKI